MKFTLFALVIALMISYASPATAAESVHLHGRFETSVTAMDDAGDEVRLDVVFQAPSGKKIATNGFWDGGKTWKVRFRPEELGAWTYTVSSKPPVAGIDGQSGAFTVTVPAGKIVNPFLAHGALRISESKTSFEHLDGTRFFFLGDTCWTGPALSSTEDWAAYLKNRVEKRFTSIQYNAISPWRTAPTDVEGRIPYATTPRFTINPEYFRRLDERMDAINDAGLLCTHVLLWAHKKGDAGFDLPEADARRLIEYQLARYGAHHVFWILAGDNRYSPAETEKWKHIGRAAFKDYANGALVTTHPTGENWPWKDWDDERWLTVLGYQSGHGDGEKTLKWLAFGPPTAAGQAKTFTRPIINLEPAYEDHVAYQSKKPHDANSIRRAIYTSLLIDPTAGVTYGGHGVWSWHTKPGTPPTDHGGSGNAKIWSEAVELPGAEQLKHLRDTFDSVAWEKLSPRPILLAEQPGDKNPGDFVAIAATPDDREIVVYAPRGKALMKKGFTGVIMTFDPRTGAKAVLRKPVEDDGVLDSGKTDDVLFILHRKSWTSLFNGKDLTGWKVPPDNVWWKVVDGVLVGEYDDKLKGSMLYTEASFQDAILDGEVRWQGEIDSGYMMRKPEIQVQFGVSRSLKRDMTGSFYVGKYPEEAQAKESAKLLKPGEWNKIRLEARGDRFTVYLNEVKASQYVDKKYSGAGPIGLQIHPGLKMKVEFRNLQVLPLDAANSSGEKRP